MFFFGIYFSEIDQAGIPDYWPIPAHVMNTYCYIMSTFTLPRCPLTPFPTLFYHLCRHFPGKVDLSVHPGVGEYNGRNEEVVDNVNHQPEQQLILADAGGVQVLLPVGALRLVPAGLPLLHSPRPLQAGRGRKGDFFLGFQYFSRLPPSSPGCTNRALSCTRMRG